MVKRLNVRMDLEKEMLLNTIKKFDACAERRKDEGNDKGKCSVD